MPIYIDQNVPGQALRFMSDIQQRDADRYQYDQDNIFRNAEAKRLDSLDRYRIDQASKSDKLRYQSAENVQQIISDSNKYVTDSQSAARVRTTELLTEAQRRRAIGEEQELVRRFGKEDAALRMDMYRQLSERANNLAQILEEGHGSTAGVTNNAAVASLLTEQHRNSGNRLYKRLFRGDDIVDGSIEFIEVPGGGIVANAKTNDGRIVQKTVDGKPVADDGSDIVGTSAEQGLSIFGVMNSSVSDHIPGYHRERIDQQIIERAHNSATNAGANTDGTGVGTGGGQGAAVDLAGNPVVTKTPTVPNHENTRADSPLPPVTQQQVEEASADTGYSPDTIQTGQDYLDSLFSGDQDVTLTAASDYVRAAYEDNGTAVFDAVSGRPEGSASMERTEVANDTGSVGGPSGIPQGGAKGVPQGGGSPTDYYAMYSDAVGPNGLSQDQFLSLPPVEQERLVAQTQGSRSEAGLSAASQAWDATKQGAGVAYNAVAERVRQVRENSAAAAAAEEARVAAGGQPKPSFARQAWENLEHGGIPVAGAAAGIIGDTMDAHARAQDLRRNPYRDAQAVTEGETQAVANEGLAGSPYAGGLVKRTTESPNSRAILAEIYERRGDKEGVEATRSGYALSTDPNVRRAQIDAQKYYTNKDNEQREGIISGNDRVPAPPRDTASQHFQHAMRKDIAKVMQRGYDLKDQLALDQLNKQLAKISGTTEGFSTGSPADIGKLVERVYEMDPQHFAARVGKATGTEVKSTRVNEWTSQQRQELTRQIVARAGHPSFWQEFGASIIRQTPLDWFMNDRNAGQIPQKTPSSADTLRAELMDVLGTMPLNKTTPTGETETEVPE